MKINSKFFVIALILVIFSIGAAAASEEVSLESSDINAVSSETLSVSSTQEIDMTNTASFSDANQVNSDNVELNETNDDKNLNYSLLDTSNDEILGNANDDILADNVIYTTVNGFDNVPLSDGYFAFCLDSRLDIPNAGTQFVSVPESEINDKYWGWTDKLTTLQYVKILLVKYLDDPELLTIDPHPYDPEHPNTKLQGLIWDIVNSKYVNYPNDVDWRINDVIQTYNSGVRYGDVVNENGKTIYFEYLSPYGYNPYMQSMIGYRVETAPEPEVLDVQKLTLNKTVYAGEQTSFKIVVKNIGNAIVEKVVVVEQSFNGLKFSSWVKDNSWTYSNYGDEHYWRYNNILYPNEEVSFIVIFDTNETGNFTNTIMLVTDRNEFYARNDTEVIDKPVPSLNVTKKSLTPVALVGDEVTFEIVVRNTGNVALNDVFVKELSYDGLTYDSFVNNGLWNYDGQKVWTLNKVLEVNEVVPLFVNFKTTQKGNFTNVVIAGSDKTENKTANNTTTVLQPNFEVQKITISPVVLVGNQVSFEIIVRNTGDVALSDVFVKELSYDGLIYDSFVENGLWTYDGQNAWTLNKVLAVNEIETLTVKFNTTQKGNFTNIVVAGSDKTENKNANNTTTVVEGKLDVQKITITPVVLVGEQVTFEIIVRNIGEATLTNVFVEESSYDGLTYDSYIKNEFWTHSVVNGKNRWTLNTNLAVNEVVGFFVVFNTTEKGNFNNVVVAGSGETENKTANNTTKVVEPKLDVEKITLTPTVPLGNQTSFEITVRNTGDVALNNVVLEETSYEGLTYDSYVKNSDWTHSVVNGKNIWTLNKVLNVHEVVSLIVNFNTTEVGNFTNIVTVGSSETENKFANNTTNVYNKTTPEPESNKTKNPKIDIEKIALNDVVMVGEQAIFEIIVKNTGDVILHDVTVTEDSFEGLIYDFFLDNSGLWINESLSWTLNTPLYVGEIASFYVLFNTTAPGEFTNIVSVDSNETDKKSANDTVEVIKPDLEVQKVAVNKSVLVGDQVIFEIVVHNTGKATLNNVVVHESSYDGLVYDSFIDYMGIWSNESSSWTLNTPLYVGEYAGFFVVFNTTSTGKFVNVVIAESDETPNKTDNDTVDVFKADVDVQKITLTPVVPLGNQTSFEIVVRNTGDVALNNVVLEETSYEGLTYDSYVKNSDWTHSVVNGKNTWTLNKVLNVNEIVTLIVNFNTTQVGKFTNIVTVGSNETDNKIANNTTNVYNRTTPEPESNTTKNPGIDVEKIALHKVVIIGNQVTFEIIVTNTGNVELNDVTVSEDSFSGLTYYSWYDNTGLWSKNSDLTWTMNSPLYVGEIASFYVVFNTTTAGNFTNIVSADSNETDKKSANDTVEVLQPNLEVQKITINRTVYVGEKVMFEIVVHNTGKVSLNDVVIHEKSYDGLVYDSFIDHYNVWTKNNDLSWTLNTPLHAGEYLNLFVVFNTSKVGTFTNVVSASSDKTQDKYANNTTTVIDRPVPEENKTTPEENKTVPEENKTYTPMADLAIVKLVYAIDGDKVTWGLYVVNNGPDKAVNARVTDVLPKTLQYINSIASKGSYDANTGIWTIGDMENGEEAVMILETLVLVTGEITNEANVTSDTIDPNLSNNYDNDTVIVTDVPETTQPKDVEPVDVAPATGNPLVMVLLALFALTVGTLRRKK